MPLYEYRCTKCGEQIEVLQKLSDAPLSRCKSCRGKLEKLISRTSFQLKGGGWFDEGYGGGSKKAPGAAAGSSSTDSKKDKKADTKKADTTKSDSTKSDSKKDSSKSAGSSS